jgi:hypothetical protein
MKAQTYGPTVEGPLGFPMREESARELGELIKTLPKDSLHEYRRKSVTTKTLTTDEQDRTDKSFITTDSPDRDGEVVLPAGGDFTQFRKNPVVTFAHRYDELPIGRALWLKRDEQNGRAGILAKTQYATKPKDWGSAPWLPSAVWALVQQGILKGKSIGFLPVEVRPPSKQELSARPDWANVRLIIAKWLLLEYAVAPVPSNPDALVQSIGKGLAVPDSLLEAMGMMIPTNTERDDPQISQISQIQSPSVLLSNQERRVAFVSEGEYRKAVAGLDPVAALRGSVLLSNIDIEAVVRDELDRRRGRV